MEIHWEAWQGEEQQAKGKKSKLKITCVYDNHDLHSLHGAWNKDLIAITTTLWEKTLISHSHSHVSCFPSPPLLNFATFHSGHSPAPLLSQEASSAGSHTLRSFIKDIQSNWQWLSALTFKGVIVGAPPVHSQLTGTTSLAPFSQKLKNTLQFLSYNGHGCYSDVTAGLIWEETEYRFLNWDLSPS